MTARRYTRKCESCRIARRQRRGRWWRGCPCPNNGTPNGAFLRQSLNFRPNHFGNKFPLLNCGGRNAGQLFASLVRRCGQVADYKNLGMLRNAQIRLYLHATGAIQRNAQFLSQRRGSDPCGPQGHCSWKTSVAYMHRSCFHMGDDSGRSYLHPQMLQLFLGAARQIFGIGWEQARAALNEQNVCTRRVNRTEFMDQCVRG